MSTERFLTFRVAGTEHGLPASRVREIAALPPITRVPGAAEHVRGVINLRGEIVPVVDLRQRLGSGPVADHPYLTVIVVEAGGGVAGLVVDGVAAMVDISRRRTREAPHAPDRRLLSAVADLEDRTIHLIDPDRAVMGAAPSAGADQQTET